MTRNRPLARINLNVFSNVASADARDCLVAEAIRSYFECFDGARGAAETITRVFCDPKPHRTNFRLEAGDSRWHQGHSGRKSSRRKA